MAEIAAFLVAVFAALYYTANTVPAAIKELEKIELIRQFNNSYSLDHAVTARQKTILKAFGMDAKSIKENVAKIGTELMPHK